MAQVYTFTDSNGEVRLMAEIDPAPGSSQPLSLLGPFTVAHDTPNLGNGVALAAVAIGTIVLRAWAEVSGAGWDSGYLHVGLGKDDGTGIASLVSYDLGQSGGAPVEFDAILSQGIVDGPPTVVFDASALVGIAQANYTSLVVSLEGTPSSGAAAVRALTYTPT